MAATTAPAPTTSTTTTPTVLAGTDREATQQFQRDIQGAKSRIDSMFGKDSEFAQILQQKLDLKGQEGQRAAGLGGGVSLDKMEKMLNALDELKKKGLSPEHIQAIFLAGFVKGGVEGVMQFIGDGKAPHLQSGDDGFNAMKRLLEDKYKRSIRYVTEHAGFLRVDIPRALDSIFKENNVLKRWLNLIDSEDMRVLDGSMDAVETWGDDPAGSNFLNHHPVLRRLAQGRRANAGRGLCVTGVLDTMAANGIPNPAATGSDPCNPRGLASQLIRDFGWQSLNIGGTKTVLNSPYGKVPVSVMSGADYERAVQNGQIPSGAIVFQTRHSWLNNLNQSSGYDAAIAIKGGTEHWNGGPAGTMIYGNTREVFVLVPGSST